MIKSHKLDIVCLLETKMDMDALNTALRTRFNGMACLHNLSFNNKIRVLLLWNTSVANVLLIEMTDQLIHVKIECVHTYVTFYATFVYGLHTRSYRKPLWSTLTRLGENMLAPWIVMGDLNSYLSPADKQGGTLIRNHETTDFGECVSSLELLDIHSVGCSSLG